MNSDKNNEIMEKYMWSKCYNYELKQKFYNLTHLTININQELKPGMLPESLTCLVFGWYYNQEIKENVLPKSITCLTFGVFFNHEIKENVLPKSLTHLIFGSRFNKAIKENVLPKSLTHLCFGEYFDQHIKPNVLPNSLTHLSFGFYYCHKIEPNVLPNSLIELNIYTKNIENIDITKTLKLSNLKKIVLNSDNDGSSRRNEKFLYNNHCYKIKFFDMTTTIYINRQKIKITAILKHHFIDYKKYSLKIHNSNKLIKMKK